VGAIISYSDNMETEKVDVTSSGEIKSFEGGFAADGLFIFGLFGLTFATNLGYTGEFESSEGTEKGDVKVRSRSFSLGDADDGDYFDVQVSSCVCTHWPDFNCCHVPADLPGSSISKLLLRYDERPEPVCGLVSTSNSLVICR
jgi:hypothetical protein